MTSKILKNNTITLKKVGIETGFIVLFLILLGVTTVLTLALGIGIIRVSSLFITSPMSFALLAAFQFIGFGIASYMYLSYRNMIHRIPIKYPSRRDIKIIFFGLGSFFVISVITSLLITHLNINTASNTASQIGQNNPVVVYALIVISILFVGPFEEIVFRGVIQETFENIFTVPLAIFLASFVFGVVHIIAITGGGLEGKAFYIVVVTVLGCLLGFYYKYSENLTVPIIIHGVYDAVLFSSLLFM